MKTQKLLGLFTLSSLFLTFSINSFAFEMQGLISYNVGQLESKPTDFQNTGDGIGYSFLGRFDLGPGQVESGFLFTPTSITLLNGSQENKITGTYWIFPLMYRYAFFPPFFSIGFGGDYAVMGTSNLISNGTTLSTNIPYLSHFGVQGSLQATQDLGEDLSLVLDIRYRKGLGNAINLPPEGTKYSFFVVALGIQKHLE